MIPLLNIHHGICSDDNLVFNLTIVRYVTGEFRFRHGYSKHNPRKMVRMWAEKEMRNLIRLETAGIPGNIQLCDVKQTFFCTDYWVPILSDVKCTWAQFLCLNLYFNFLSY